MTYQVYLRDTDQLVTQKTITTDPSIASEAFAVLVNRSDLDGKPILAVLNKDGKLVAQHDFRFNQDGKPRNPSNHWRGRLEKIRLQTEKVRATN